MQNKHDLAKQLKKAGTSGQESTVFITTGRKMSSLNQSELFPSTKKLLSGRINEREDTALRYRTKKERRESNERNEKEAVAGNSYDSEKAGQRKPGNHQKQRRDSESQRHSRRAESGVVMKKKYEDMTPEEQRKYLDKMNRQTEGISLAALALSFVSLVILVIKKRLGL